VPVMQNTAQLFDDAALEQFLAPVEFAHELCVVIPAYNEAAVIEASLKALARIISLEHVYVVSDGSKDATAELARRHTSNVLDLTKNQGKAQALNSLIGHFGLTTKYRYILFSDADSQLEAGFVEAIQEKAALLPACIVGAIVSHRKGFISAYRTVEYGLANRIYRQAQSHLGVISVAPGCAAAYRSDVLRELHFAGGTLTEDYDLTLQIHAKRLGAIVYAPGARVVTQDPPTVDDYWKQITRWYTGFWQNFFLHKLYAPRRAVHVEVLLVTADGLSWLASILAAFLFPQVLVAMVLGSVILSWLASAVIISLERAWWALPYFPLFPVFQFMNITSYTYSFGRAIFGGKQLSWNKVARYAIS
jgi:poly-beta-1,6-N-acetyl-D-glucosamine synthase